MSQDYTQESFLCSIGGCARLPIARGWCSAHYKRWIRYGSPEGKRGDERTPGPTCTLEGCRRPLHTKKSGLCSGHLRRLRVKGDVLSHIPLASQLVPGDECLVGDCSEVPKSLGYCNAHYLRLKRHGDPLKFAPKKPRPLCKVVGCQTKARARGWCKMHYHRWKNHGDPLAKVTKPGMGPVQQFVREAARHEDPVECLRWPFAMHPNGYGQGAYTGPDGKRRSMNAHRAVLMESVGPPPGDNYQACHDPILCQHRDCVNPHHLRWGTPAENMADKEIAGTLPRGTMQWNSKLTESDVVKIRADTRPHAEISQDYGVAEGTINTVKARRSWAWVPDAGERDVI